MVGVSKIIPPQRQILKNIYLSFFYGAKIGIIGLNGSGKSISLIVIDGSVLGEDFPECKDSKMCLINPELEVIEDMEPVSRNEGCLSLPGMSENVKRIEHVRLNWLDENFVEHEKEFTGFLARIIQHEFDHLLGTVYTDRISPIRKQMVRNKLNNLARGKVKCDYRTVSAKK